VADDAAAVETFEAEKSNQTHNPLRAAPGRSNFRTDLTRITDSVCYLFNRQFFGVALTILRRFCKLDANLCAEFSVIQRERASPSPVS
jgi:hypothetical protein